DPTSKPTTTCAAPSGPSRRRGPRVEVPMENRLKSMLLAAGLGIAALFAGAVGAQPYPAKPIRIIVPIPPGGAPDVTARVVGARLAERLGQAVVIENRTGSNGNIAGDLVAKSAPDGYTLLLGQDTLITVNPHLYGKMPFD